VRDINRERQLKREREREGRERREREERGGIGGRERGLFGYAG
jgi:hypothetical protein